MNRAHSFNPFRAVPVLFALILNIAAGPLMPFAQSTMTRAANDGISDYAQCQIGNPRPAGLDCELWTNGILNATHNQYAEDEVVPQRLLMDFGAAGSHTVTITYLTRKDAGTIQHAYDSLATWNYTYTNADRCQQPTATECLARPATTFPIPSDSASVPPGGPQPTSAHELPQAARQFVMYGGTLTGASAITHDTAPAATGDDYASITVTFNATRSDGKVQLLFGGHLAAGFGPRGWGANLGAANINGGPYHIRITAIDNAAIGNRDNQIMSNAIAPLPGLALSKSTTTPIIDAGATASYTISIANAGDGDATGVTITDNLPGGLTWSDNSASCSISTSTLTCGPMTVAAHTTFSVTLTATTNADSCPSLSNTASYTSTNGGSGSTAATPTVITVNCPAIHVTKTADADSVSAGSPIGFTVALSASGTGQAKGVSFSDDLPAGSAVNWTIPLASSGWSISGSAPTQSLVYSGTTLDAGSSTSVHIVSATTKDSCKVYDNTASVSSTNAGSDQASASTEVLCPSVHVTKTADADSVSAGDQIGFVVTLSNTGAGEAKGLSFSDDLPAGTGVSWSLAAPSTGWSISGSAPDQSLVYSPTSLAAYSSTSVHIVSATTKDSCKVYDNTASVSTSNDGSGEASDSTEVLCPVIEVTKVADAETVSAGTPIGFTVAITNSGKGDAYGVTLTDALPGGNASNPVHWVIDASQFDFAAFSISGADGSQALSLAGQPISLAAGATLKVHITAATSASNCATYDNTASASATNDGSDSASASVVVECPGLNIAKTAAKSPIAGGDSASFTIVVWNAGPGTATNVTLDDPLPGGLAWTEDSDSCTISGSNLHCSFGDLGVTTEANSPARVTVTAPTTRNDCGTLDNLATAHADNNADVTASASIEVVCPILVIDKAASVDEVHFVFHADGTLKSVTPANAQVTWTLTYTLTDGPVTNAVISDPLPDFLTFVSADNGGTYDAATRTITWHFATLSASGVVSFVTTVEQDAPETGPIVNVASIVSDQTPKEQGQDDVRVTSEEVQAATSSPNPSVPNTATVMGQNGQPIQIPIELLVLFFIGSLGTLTFANVRAVRSRR
jgi:uncharacterized repeat protein (TIGR01451 family)